MNDENHRGQRRRRKMNDENHRGQGRRRMNEENQRVQWRRRRLNEENQRGGESTEYYSYVVYEAGEVERMAKFGHS